MITNNVHDAANVRLGPIKQLTDTQAFTRKISFQCDETTVEITLFSDIESNLEVIQS